MNISAVTFAVKPDGHWFINGAEGIIGLPVPTSSPLPNS